MAKIKNIYRKGARKEYAIISQLRKQGWDIVQRSAGSHSPIDIFAIKKREKKILFIQSKRTLSEKMSYINPELILKILNEEKDLPGIYEVFFEVR